jgi:hypothetical protein
MNTRIRITLLGLFAVALLIPTVASAHRYDRTRDFHPLRVIGFGVNAVGIATEYVVTRPIHWVVSQGELDIVFGHRAHLEDKPFFEWVHGDYSPSVSRERSE